ncbi:uncharacterized protein M421DRAFT_423859 [Didymella exigua CBS 183.55]|uniref:F-box domain-containing protein n=1 Tax=Didymella exigua CBS 183.55 TaxID=1150837 RepID=A0A6A5RDK2_9PLEO|nr:uncharacterized protein M421DRAFT_423859 [Didymella exigua CBS 183.55]KAF1925308.1 hypothetical protein M421DRAFT_423859 [Didymella exigua CBS 183.55]
MTGFEDLNDDVLYLILDYLYLERASALRRLRLTSSRLKEFAEAVAHRSISLVDDVVHDQFTYRLAERLTDPTDKLCHYVRDLLVVNFKGDAESYCLNNILIAKCLEHVQRLDSFSWDSDTPIPGKTLDVLRQRFPRAQLYANIRTIDMRLLSTTQLHRLDISVPCLDLSNEYSISFFGVFKQALLRLVSLCHLGIDTHYNANFGKREGRALDRLQLPFEPGDKLPSLVSLALRSKSYAFDTDHCKMLHAAMDCDKVQRLIIGSPNPGNFFQVFNGHLPRLTHLDVSYTSIKDDPRHRRLESLSIFVAGLVSLKSFVFRCNNLDLRADFARLLAVRHGPTLVRLSLQAIQENVEGPSFAGNIRTFLWKFTDLQLLDMAFPSIRSCHRCPDCEDYQWGEAKHFSFVPPLPSLRGVHLSIRAPLLDRSLYASIDKHAHCTICHLWTTFVEHPESQLETLGIRFWRWAMNGRQPCVEELIYDTVRLRGELSVKIRHHREIPVVIYKEVWDPWDRQKFVAFEVAKDKREAGIQML